MRTATLLIIISMLYLPFTSFPVLCAEPEQTPDYTTEDPGEQPAPPYENLDQLFNQYQPYLENIAVYEPIYFLLGGDPEDSKFQVSLKYRFLNPEKTTFERYNWMEGFHIAYTQTSYWDLKSDSQPFDDTSYKPELFFLSPNLFSGLGFSHVFLQTGFQHESNGRAEEESRSTNFLYVEPIFVFYHESTGIGIQIVPRIWTYINNDDDTNPDLYKYRGYFDLEMKLGKADGLVLESHWRKAREGHSIHLDLSYPLDSLIDTRFQIYIHAQYVDALAENLLDYESRNRAFRFGLSIVR